MRKRNEYPENWNDTIRPSILKRDEYKCTKCRIKHRSYVFIDQAKKRIVIEKDEYDELREEGKNAYRVYLQVSHKNHEKEDCRPENLQTMCPACHMDYDRRHVAIMKNSISERELFECTDIKCPYSYSKHKHTSPNGVIIVAM